MSDTLLQERRQSIIQKVIFLKGGWCFLVFPKDGASETATGGCFEALSFLYIVFCVSSNPLQ